MNRTTSLVALLSLLLLGGAWFASKALTADVLVPPSAPEASRPVPLALPVRDSLGVKPPLPMVPPVPVGDPTPVEPRVITLVPVSGVPPPLVRPVLPFPPSFPPRAALGPGEQLDEEGQLAAKHDDLVQGAWGELTNVNGGSANWRRAEKAFERCLSQRPDDDRCKQGVAEARKLIGPRVNPLGYRPPPPPPASEED